MRLLLLLPLILSACSNLTPHKSGDNFYTWVDERGVVHTLKKPESKEAALNPSPTKRTKSFVEKKALKDSDQIDANPARAALEFNSADFISSDDVDRKIAGDKLFTWDEDGRQIIAEIPLSKNTVDNAVANTTLAFIESQKEFREGKEILLSQIISREIKLSNYFNSTEGSKKDYILIELDGPDLQTLKFNSFVRNQRVAMPAITILQHDYLATAQNTAVFSSYKSETWSSYGVFSGVVSIPQSAKYILLTPNPIVGVIETEDGDITINDFGIIQLKY